jgi:hypothetical protein
MPGARGAPPAIEAGAVHWNPACAADPIPKVKAQPVKSMTRIVFFIETLTWRKIFFNAKFKANFIKDKDREDVKTPKEILTVIKHAPFAHP